MAQSLIPADFDATIHVMPYTHADIAWVHTRAWHIDRYARVMDEVLQLFETDPDYHFYIDTWVELIRPYIAIRPGAVEAIRQRVREGRLAVCGGQYGNVRSTAIGNETQIRNMQLGMRHWKELAPAVEFRVHSNIDVTLGHTQMPQMLTLAGLNAYFVMRPLAALDAQGIPRAFHWQGLSGDRIVVYRDMGVGLFQEHERCGPTWDADWSAVVRHLWSIYLRQPAKDGISHIGLSVGVDDSRPDRFAFNDLPADYGALMRLWNERGGGRMRYGTPDTLIAALRAEADRLKVIDEVLDPTDVSYNIALNGRRGIWWLREQADRLLVDAEILSAFAQSVRGVAYPEDAITELWEQLLDWTPHAVQWLFRQDWQEGELALQDVVRDAKKEIEKASVALVEACLPLDAAGIAVINTLPGRVREVAPFWIVNSDMSRGLTALKDVHGDDVAFQVIDFPVPCAEISLLAQVDTPGCGFTTLRTEWETAPSGITYPEAEAHWRKRYVVFEKQPIEQGLFTLASDCVRITLDQRRVTIVEDLVAGIVREAPAGASFLEPVSYPITRTGWSSDAISDEPDGFQVESARWDEAGPLRWRITRTGRTGGFWVRQHLDLLKGERAVRSTVQFLDPGDNSDALIAVSIPIGEQAELSVDIPFGIEPRAVKEIQYGISERAIPGLFWGRTWADTRDESGRVALVTADGDKHFRAFGTPRRLVHFLAQKTRVFEESWESHLDTYDAGGRQVFQHIMALAGREEARNDLIRLAERLRHPLLSQYAPEAQVGLESEFLAITPATVCLSAMHYEGGDLMLRLVQMAPAIPPAAEPAEVCVDLPFAPASATLIDFRGRPLAIAVACEGNQIRFNIKAWQIASLRIEA